MATRSFYIPASVRRKRKAERDSNREKEEMEEYVQNIYVNERIKVDKAIHHLVENNLLPTHLNVSKLLPKHLGSLLVERYNEINNTDFKMDF